MQPDQSFGRPVRRHMDGVKIRLVLGLFSCYTEESRVPVCWRVTLSQDRQHDVLVHCWTVRSVDRTLTPSVRFKIPAM